LTKRAPNTEQAMTKTNYTFGDSDEASLRLRNGLKSLTSKR
jgi:hypothetical protein